MSKTTASSSPEKKPRHLPCQKEWKEWKERCWKKKWKKKRKQKRKIGKTNKSYFWLSSETTFSGWSCWWTSSLWWSSARKRFVSDHPACSIEALSCGKLWSTKRVVAAPSVAGSKWSPVWPAWGCCDRSRRTTAEWKRPFRMSAGLASRKNQRATEDRHSSAATTSVDRCSCHHRLRSWNLPGCTRYLASLPSCTSWTRSLLASCGVARRTKSNEGSIQSATGQRDRYAKTNTSRSETALGERTWGGA